MDSENPTRKGTSYLAISASRNNGNEKILSLRAAVFVCLRVGPKKTDELERRRCVRFGTATREPSKRQKATATLQSLSSVLRSLSPSRWLSDERLAFDR